MPYSYGFWEKKKGDVDHTPENQLPRFLQYLLDGIPSLRKAMPPEKKKTTV